MSCSSWVSLSKWHGSRTLKGKEWRGERVPAQETARGGLRGRREPGMMSPVRLWRTLQVACGKGFAFYPHCNGNLEVLSITWFTYFGDHSDIYVENDWRGEAGRLRREAFIRIQARDNGGVSSMKKPGCFHTKIAYFPQDRALNMFGRESCIYSFIQSSNTWLLSTECFKPHFKAGFLKVKESQTLLSECLERSMLFRSRSWIRVEAILGKEPRWCSCHWGQWYQNRGCLISQFNSYIWPCSMASP